MNAKQCKGTMEDIAEATGQPLSTVRRHCRLERFSLSSFVSVCRYVAGYVLLGIRDAETEGEGETQ